MRYVFIFIVLTIVFFLITFFGLGPVVFADGASQERLVTLAVVILMYAALAWLVFYFIKLFKRNRERQ